MELEIKAHIGGSIFFACTFFCIDSSHLLWVLLWQRQNEAPLLVRSRLPLHRGNVRRQVVHSMQSAQQEERRSSPGSKDAPMQTRVRGGANGPTVARQQQQSPTQGPGRNSASSRANNAIRTLQLIAQGKQHQRPQSPVVGLEGRAMQQSPPRRSGTWQQVQQLLWHQTQKQHGATMPNFRVPSDPCPAPGSPVGARSPVNRDSLRDPNRDTIRDANRMPRVHIPVAATLRGLGRATGSLSARRDLSSKLRDASSPEDLLHRVEKIRSRPPAGGRHSGVGARGGMGWGVRGGSHREGVCNDNDCEEGEDDDCASVLDEEGDDDTSAPGVCA